MLSYLLLIVLALTSVSGWAADILQLEEVTVKTCASGMMGCLARVKFGDQELNLNTSTIPKDSGVTVITENGDSIVLKNIEAVVLPHTFWPGNTQDAFYFVASDADAKISLCNTPMLLGCAPKINVKGESYLLDTSAVDAAILAGPDSSVEVSVKGYVAYEKGHFPNPTAYFDVFKVLEISVKDKAEAIIEVDRMMNDEEDEFEDLSQEDAFKAAWE